ncbi:Predicted PurR-regulated permease PerM [Oceanobacillus limi]|uniref:Predicted PurR-regulated permease PerM n=1 Tax=Oceanobacillus limi TaxID=930131 RepID=A0A1I0B2B3_9BACI|nr:AI-2E family transporter [Oceanobacillus limi]SET00880.1 Predicted PurR-regulated permease PerM [Oceanobacillus limi]
MKSFSRFMNFIGGRDLLFGLVLLILLGIVIFIYTKISFIFTPVVVILSTITPPIILAFIAYYLLNPIVDLLEKVKVKRIWGILIIILGISGLLTGIILLSAPAVEAQVKELIKNFPIYLGEMGNSILQWIQNSIFGDYYEQGYNWVVSYFSDIPGMIGTYLGDAFEGIRNVASTVTNVFVALFTFPFILFFLLKDGDRFKRYFIKLFPPRSRGDVQQILHNMDVQVGSYIQGQIIVASCIGILLFIGYLIIGLDYAITLAIIAAVTSVVPYLGPTIAIIPAIIIAIVDSPFMLLKLAIVWIAVQFLEGNFVSPNIMGRTMKIHPLTIIIVLLVAGNLFGVIGVILGIPGYAILKVIITYLFVKFQERYDHYYGVEYGFYQDTDEQKE